MSKRAFRICASILAAVTIALIGMNIAADADKTWDVCFEMTNRRVEWTGAGYSGIYGRR